MQLLESQFCSANKMFWGDIFQWNGWWFFKPSLKISDTTWGEVDPFISNGEMVDLPAPAAAATQQHGCFPNTVNAFVRAVLLQRCLIKSNSGLQMQCLCGQSRGLWVALGGRYGLTNIWSAVLLCLTHRALQVEAAAYKFCITETLLGTVKKA